MLDSLPADEFGLLWNNQLLVVMRAVSHRHFSTSRCTLAEIGRGGESALVVGEGDEGAVVSIVAEQFLCWSICSLMK